MDADGVAVVQHNRPSHAKVLVEIPPYASHSRRGSKVEHRHNGTDSFAISTGDSGLLQKQYAAAFGTHNLAGQHPTQHEDEQLPDGGHAGQVQIARHSGRQTVSLIR
jgi:hypothetical protein